MSYDAKAEILNTKLLQRIREEREKTGLSQWDFAIKIGLGQSAYHKIEKGKTRLDMFRFFKIAEALDVPASALMDN
ncbi:hypothetical protein LPB136_12140 [Tenacibaculum todarodis]|uniref:HTH cro/C1-type domain-containing protein n=1 Tax=Tenacibaculum todarodis TaxID=1850252 RepID=A0A1L3JLU8_9FLAO|nr:helix-turn-helix transcriptional regulator [Tenacibaculum todarodis]APG66072.1 hypothetical protein LPB136_12140 [Tenacibaculum todarodis]